MSNNLNPGAVACADMVAITSTGFPDIPLRNVIRASIRAYLAADAIPAGEPVAVAQIAERAIRDEANAHINGE